MNALEQSLSFKFPLMSCEISSRYQGKWMQLENTFSPHLSVIPVIKHVKANAQEEGKIFILCRKINVFFQKNFRREI